MTEFTFKGLNDDLKKQQLEYRLQVACVEQIPGWFPGLRFFHIPNRPGDATDGFFKQKMGAKKGASDLVFSWRSDSLQCGLIELKAAGGRLSSDQNKFLSSFAAIGWRTAVEASCGGVKQRLISWGLEPAHSGCCEPDYRTESEKKQAAFDMFKP